MHSVLTCSVALALMLALSLPWACQPRVGSSLEREEQVELADFQAAYTTTLQRIWNKRERWLEVFVENNELDAETAWKLRGVYAAYLRKVYELRAEVALVHCDEESLAADRSANRQRLAHAAALLLGDAHAERFEGALEANWRWSPPGAASRGQGRGGGSAPGASNRK